MKAKIKSLDPTGVEVESVEFELPLIDEIKTDEDVLSVTQPDGTVIEYEPKRVYRYYLEIGKHIYQVNARTGELKKDSNFFHDERARQLMSFKGMERRSEMRPTDIDGFMDYNSKVHIYFEGKVKGTSPSSGQIRALDSICQAYYEEKTEPKWKSKVLVWILIFEHNIPVDQDVIVAEQEVVQVVSNINDSWREPTSADVIPKFELDSDKKLTVISAIKQIERWCKEHEVGIILDKE